MSIFVKNWKIQYVKVGHQKIVLEKLKYKDKCYILETLVRSLGDSNLNIHFVGNSPSAIPIPEKN